MQQLSPASPGTYASPRDSAIRCPECLAFLDRLRDVLVAGRGIDDLCANLARLFAAYVAIVDPVGALISFCSPAGESDTYKNALFPFVNCTGSEPVLDDPTLRAALTRTKQERRPVMLPPIDQPGLQHQRVVAPVCLGEEVLAHIWVLESQRTLDVVDLAALQWATLAIAGQLMKQKAVGAEYKLREELVTGLVRVGEPEESLFRQALCLGIDLNEPRAVLVINADDHDAYDQQKGCAHGAAVAKSALLEVLQRLCQRDAPGALASGREQEIIVLAGMPATSEAERQPALRKLADALRSEVQHRLPGVTVSVGVGTWCGTLGEYPQSYHRARRALEVIRGLQQSDRTVAFEDLGIYEMLFHPLSRDKLVSLVQKALGALVAHDNHHTTPLMGTLEQYLLHDGHLERTAETLHVHISTLRYRLQRIETLTGADLHSAETKFNLQLALKVLRCLEPAEQRRLLSAPSPPRWRG